MTDIATLIQNVTDGDNVQASSIFDQLMGAKVNDALEAEKVKMADVVFNGAEEDDPEIEDEDLEDVEEEESDEEESDEEETEEDDEEELEDEAEEKSEEDEDVS